MNKKVWSSIFLGLTGIVVGMEVWAANDSTPDTRPWTSFILQYLPKEVTYAVIAGFAVWLYFHFKKYYGEQK